jgi:hypothetical protein
MTKNSFVLRSREDIAAFEARLDQYVKAMTGLVVPSIHLVNAYDKLQGREDRQRVINALLDVQINYRLVFCDLINMTALQHDSDSLEGDSVLSSGGV